MAKASRERTLRILSAVPKVVRERLRPVIEAQAAEVVAMQKRLVPAESGALRKSIRWRMGSFEVASSANLTAGGGRRGGAKGGGLAVKGDPDLTATIVAGDRVAFYARFVEFGTKAHRIRPRTRGGSLAIGGRVLAPGEVVSHPGARPKPFFFGPFRASRKRIKRRVATATGKAVREAAAT